VYAIAGFASMAIRSALSLMFVVLLVVSSSAKPRESWKNRYGAVIGLIKLIKPAISLAAI
jgi:hypothetical protein